MSVWRSPSKKAGRQRTSRARLERAAAEEAQVDAHARQLLEYAEPLVRNTDGSEAELNSAMQGIVKMMLERHRTQFPAVRVDRPGASPTG
jgi:hypothetical protein